MRRSWSENDPKLDDWIEDPFPDSQNEVFAGFWCFLGQKPGAGSEMPVSKVS